ncbi:acetate/propionate family kinase [Candidatus Peregrinibacteria bacterium]|nr:acetate/propionate family kinase [Candidatus Peregrinibacteria bacterium]
MHKILCINVGSTTEKYSYFHVKDDIQKVMQFNFSYNSKEAKLHIFECLKNTEVKKKASLQLKEESLSFVLQFLKDKEFINSIKDIDSFCVRVVHGGSGFTQPTYINNSNVSQLEKIQDLAPLHNPFSYTIIKKILSLHSKAQVLAVFDTSFHISIPQHISGYALPSQWTEKFSLKKFGFHGIVLASVLRKLQENYKQIPQKIIVCHLGGGCSVTAISHGKSLDTSMGFSALDGLMMVSRSGSVDPGMIQYLMKKTKKSYDEVLSTLLHASGLLAVAGADTIENIVQRALKGDSACNYALDMFCYQVMKFIYAYYGSLQGLDCLVFSGGIGEGSTEIRKRICAFLEPIHLTLDAEKNNVSFSEFQEIQSKTSLATILIVHPEEDKEMIRELV